MLFISLHHWLKCRNVRRDPITLHKNIGFLVKLLRSALIFTPIDFVIRHNQYLQVPR